MFFKKREIVELLQTMRDNFWTIEMIRDSKLKKVYVRYHDILRNKCLFYIGIYLSTVVSFFVGPLLSEGEVLSYECYRPPWLTYHQLLCVVNICGTTITLFTLIPVDMLFMSVITLTTMQFLLLNEELQNVVQDEIEGKDVERTIRRCIRHHSFLLNYMRRINEVFSMRLVLFFGIILITMCLEMYRSTCPDSDWKTFAESILYTTSGLYEFLSCYCFPVQFLINQADKVSEIIYQTNWYKSRYRGQSAFFMILLGQKGVKIAAGGVVNIDFATGLSTVKTMVSYCMFLKSIDID
ncbi:unnamed protein product [Acanthoscelides obtectus]|uniref:Odorant receptor n=1 Tax=Acanthoscelides obtectus TaxID=200917 RepID=A0A9P0PY69_ACAOB|nr:unnamed protein product [Acanthoscelides obtectus]CAK1619948.1 Odorant receptor 22a [Acanthoscelides obtectus]